jgi:hypothetical protein
MALISGASPSTKKLVKAVTAPENLPVEIIVAFFSRNVFSPADAQQ